MKTTKTLLAAAVLGFTGVALADSSTVAANVPYALPYAPYGYAPVQIDAEQVKAAVEQYNRQMQAAFEQAQRSYAAALEQQRKATEDFQRFHAEQLKAASAGQQVSFEDLRKRGDAMGEDMARISDDVRERVFSGDRGAMKAYFDAKARDVDARLASVEQEIAASRKALDARVSEAYAVPVAPVALPGMPSLPTPSPAPAL